MLDQIDKLLNKNFDIFRIDLTIEEEEDGIELVELIVEYLKNQKQQIQNKIRDKILRMYPKGFTRGHFFRGVE